MNIEPIYQVLDRLDAELPAPRVDIAWHNADDETAQRIVDLFPERDWEAESGGSHQWVKTIDRGSGVMLLVHLSASAPVPAANERGERILAAAQQVTA